MATSDNNVKYTTRIRSDNSDCHAVREPLALTARIPATVESPKHASNHLDDERQLPADRTSGIPRITNVAHAPAIWESNTKLRGIDCKEPTHSDKVSYLRLGSCRFWSRCKFRQNSLAEQLHRHNRRCRHRRTPERPQIALRRSSKSPM